VNLRSSKGARSFPDVTYSARTSSGTWSIPAGARRELLSQVVWGYHGDKGVK